MKNDIGVPVSRACKAVNGCWSGGGEAVQTLRVALRSVNNPSAMHLYTKLIKLSGSDIGYDSRWKAGWGDVGDL